MRTVGEVAKLAGVSVRTLHHYDEIGLLSPSGRSEAGYRLYSHEELARLQEILGWRALGFSLARVKALLEDPGYDRGRALRGQRELVRRDSERLAGLTAALDAAITAHQNRSTQKETSMFDGFDPTEYDEEARERWGHTEAYRESARRTAGYGEREWTEIREESAAIVADFADLMAAGELAGAEPARAAAERHRAHISRWFYPCQPGMHRQLGEMYTANERFARNYERVAPGLAAYLRDAVAANAASLEALSP